MVSSGAVSLSAVSIGAALHSPWFGFHAVLIALLACEWGMRQYVHTPLRRAIYATILWTLAALSLFGLIWKTWHGGPALQFLAGYAMEEALSVDNLFLFLLLFRVFQIPENRQGKVLFWGVGGAIVLRGAFIAGGLGLLDRFAWLDYVFGVILFVAALRLLRPESGDNQPPGWIAWLTRVSPVSPSHDSFLARENGRLLPTVLLLALVAVELTDVVFALDSIPAVLSITRSPFLAYTSNILAVMGLRSLYILLAGMLSRLRFLHFGLAAVLAFAAFKIFAERWLPVGPLLSLAVIGLTLGITIMFSLLFPAPGAPAAAEKRT